MKKTREARRSTRAFTLVELLTVVGIMVLMAGLLMPAFTNLQGASNITKAAYDVAGALQNARAYAIASNTYVWVGFFEEIQSAPGSGTAGTGRVILSTIASSDGTSGPIGGAPTAPSASLFLVNKLLKVDNTHVAAFTGAAGSVMASGTGTSTGGGNTFDTRPLASAQIVLSGSTQFQVGSYQFKQMLQFNPRGEVTLSGSGNQLLPVVEVGLQPTHGTAPDVNNRNVAAIQITGVAGNVTIYRR
jgi:type II secretory pathway pseudopilin PulG